MDLSCPACGAAFEAVPEHGDGALDLTCRVCGSHLTLRTAGAAATAAPLSAAVDSSSATLFQPRALVEVAVEETAPTRPAAIGSPAPVALVAPVPAPEGSDGWFLVLGAPPGRERLRLESARTVFGRAGGGADVGLDDASLAPRQFQIDVMGREFYLRDLAGDTRLNGREVRFMELLPGDEVAAGATVLVFRAAGDGLGRSR